MKHRKRKNKDLNTILTCHDELLAELYSLNTKTVYHQQINGQDYLIVEKKLPKATIGLRAKIPKELLIVHGKETPFSELTIGKQKHIIYQLQDKLTFSSQDILIFNILLDKFFKGTINLSISFRNIDAFYRRKVTSYKNVKVNSYTYKAYLKAIKHLTEKEVFVKTAEDFRHKKYGVNGRNFYHPLLTIFNIQKLDETDISFSYSFGQFGEILKRSKRFSDTLPNVGYQYSFKQATKHVIAYYIVRKIFIKLGDKRVMYNNCGNFYLYPCELMCVPYTDKKGNSKNCTYADVFEDTIIPNRLRMYKMFVTYIHEILAYLPYYYDLILDFEPDEWNEDFTKKHEFDYDIDGNLQTENLGIKDITFDTNVSFEICLY